MIQRSDTSPAAPDYISKHDLYLQEFVAASEMETSRDAARLSRLPQFTFQSTLMREEELTTDERNTALPHNPRAQSQSSYECKERYSPSAFAVDSTSNLDRKSSLARMVRNLTSSTLGADLGFAAHLHQPPTWQPTFLRAFPLVGTGALLIATCCVFSSLGILIGSDGEPTENWKWPPTVFLAIFSAIINRVLQFALLQALPIAWWHKAWSGATIAELQRRWEASEGTLSQS